MTLLVSLVEMIFLAQIKKSSVKQINKHKTNKQDRTQLSYSSVLAMDTQHWRILTPRTKSNQRLAENLWLSELLTLAFSPLCLLSP